MNEQTWTEVDRYLESKLIPHDPALDAAIAESRAAGLPEIAVSPIEGNRLALLARIRGARRILEIGTLGGYSAIWLAQALPVGGELITLEIDPKHAAVAQRNIDRAGVTDKVKIIVGPALESLARLAGAGIEPFDFFFVDADKKEGPAYLEWAIKLSRPGAVVVVDNVIRDGDVIDEQSDHPSVKGVRALFDLISQHPRVEATAIQTVGQRGYDGILIAHIT